MPTPNANNDKFVINRPKTLADRPKTLEGWLALWTPAECVEIFNRYCDVKDREEKYRKLAAAKMKAVKAYLAENPDVAAEIEDSIEDSID